jgi:lipoprotein NlpD
VAMALVHGGCLHNATGLRFLGQTTILEQKQTVPGTYHAVVEGEDLSAIARAYHVDAQQLAEVNNLKAPYRVALGAKVFIPEVSPEERAAPLKKESREPAPVSEFKGRLGWPVQGKVVSEFGVREGAQYNGIKIQAPEGTPVLAAADGRVGHVLSLPDYGNLVLIEHADRLGTVYAHLKDISVSKGDQVTRGTPIGTVGSSGRADEPLLYFEVRSRSKPRNPLFFLDRKQ